jgi:excisionase family DNA binding protein
MTGRDLIMYILSNKLEDDPIFEDGKFIGCVTVEEAAVKLEVGVATVHTLIDQGIIKSLKIGETYFIPIAGNIDMF